MAIEGSGIKAPSKKATRMAMATYRVDPLDKMIRDIDKASKKLSGQESTGAVKETGRGMGDTFNPFKDRVDASPTIKGGFFSPGGGAFDSTNNVQIASADLSGFTGSDFSVANDANKVTGIVNQASQNLADASYDTTYKQETSPGYEDSYKQIKQIFDKPKKEDFKTTVEKRFSKSMYGGEGISEEQAIDTFRRKNLDYESGTDFFGRKVDYSPETIKRYIATDAKEKYEKDQAFKRTQQLNEARKIAAQERKKIDDQAYVRAMQKFDKPSITQRVSNFVFGTDLKGKPDPRNQDILTKDERLSTLRGVERAYGVPGISVDPYGIPTVPYDKINPDTKFKTRTPAPQLSGEDFRAKENIERKKIFREQAGLSPNPNLIEKTQNFLGGVVDNVSKIFTPSAEAATPESAQKAIQQTTGQTRLAGQGVPFGSVNLGIAKDPSNVARAQSIAARNPNVSIDKSGVARPTSNTGVARAQAAAVNRISQGKTVSQVNAENRQNMRDRARARNEARKKRIAASRGKKSQTRSGTSATAASAKTAVKKSRSFNRSKSRRSGPSGATSRSRGATGSASRRASRSGTRSSSKSTGRAGRRGGSAGSAGSRSRGGTGSKSRRSSSKGRSTNTSRSRRRTSGARRSRRGRRGRRGRRCDLRCKFNIMPLTNMNLIRDDLAEVAYFVKELQA